MATFKAMVRTPRKDGFYQVYIRVVHNTKPGYIKTDKVLTEIQPSALAYRPKNDSRPISGRLSFLTAPAAADGGTNEVHYTALPARCPGVQKQQTPGSLRESALWD